MVYPKSVIEPTSYDAKNCWLTWLRKEIRSRRQDAGLTQWDIGEMMGYSQSYISQLETSSYRWNQYIVREFVEAFGIPWKDVADKMLACLSRGCQSCSYLHKYK